MAIQSGVSLQYTM